MESGMAIMKWALMACLVLSSLSMTNSESFQDCYSSCFVVCTVTPGISFSDCPSRCLHSCLNPSTSMNNTNVVHQPQQNRLFCKLGCATFSCTKFSTKEYPAEKEVGSCVESCSLACSRH